MQKRIWIFLVYSTFFFSGTLSLSSLDDGNGYRRSDLFLDGPFFLGIPDSAKMTADGIGLNVDFGPSLSTAQLALQNKLKVGKNQNIAGRAFSSSSPSSPSSQWPGRKNINTLQNAGADVVKLFTKNLEGQQTAPQLGAGIAARKISIKVDKCDKKCQAFDILSEKSVCLVNCATRNNPVLSKLSDVLYQGIKTLCHTVNTFYSNFDKLSVTNLETFQAVMKKIEAPMPVSSNIPLGAMLARLISDVFSALTPFRPLLANFKRDLTDLETSLNLKENVLVGANPGCSMVDMKMHIETALDVLVKDPSLSDYIMLQGYALFTALTKYVDEFPTKNKFAVLNQALDMMLGTTCGLILYGATGETSNCDQFGGYPVLNMPVPEFMWPDHLDVSCQETREKMLLNKQKENARRKRESAAAIAAAEKATLYESKSAEVNVNEDKETLTGKIQRRRRRSLAVGRK